MSTLFKAIFWLLTFLAVANASVIKFQDSIENGDENLNATQETSIYQRQKCSKSGGSCSIKEGGSSGDNYGCCFGYYCEAANKQGGKNKCFKNPNKNGREGDVCLEDQECKNGNCIEVTCGSANNKFCGAKGQKCEKLGKPGCKKGDKCQTYKDCCPNPGDTNGVCDIDRPSFDYKGKYICTTGPKSK